MITYEELISMFMLDSSTKVNPADYQRDTPDLQSRWCVVGKQSSRRVTPAIAIEFLFINARSNRIQSASFRLNLQMRMMGEF